MWRNLRRCSTFPLDWSPRKIISLFADRDASLLPSYEKGIEAAEVAICIRFIVIPDVIGEKSLFLTLQEKNSPRLTGLQVPKKVIHIRLLQQTQLLKSRTTIIIIPYYLIIVIISRRYSWGILSLSSPGVVPAGDWPDNAWPAQVPKKVTYIRLLQQTQLLKSRITIENCLLLKTLRTSIFVCSKDVTYINFCLL